MRLSWQSRVCPARPLRKVGPLLAHPWARIDPCKWPGPSGTLGVRGSARPAHTPLLHCGCVRLALHPGCRLRAQRATADGRLSPGRPPPPPAARRGESGRHKWPGPAGDCPLIVYTSCTTRPAVHACRPSARARSMPPDRHEPATNVPASQLPLCSAPHSSRNCLAICNRTWGRPGATLNSAAVLAAVARCVG